MNASGAVTLLPLDERFNDAGKPIDLSTLCKDFFKFRGFEVGFSRVAATINKCRP